jgi:cytochrome c553
MRRLLWTLVLATVFKGAAAQPADPEPGRSLAAACAACHGTNGANAGGLPDLAGQPRDRIAEQLRDFRGGRGPATIMHQISKGYTDAQIDALAVFFASRKPR